MLFQPPEIRRVRSVVRMQQKRVREKQNISMSIRWQLIVPLAWSVRDRREFTPAHTFLASPVFIGLVTETSEHTRLCGCTEYICLDLLSRCRSVRALASQLAEAIARLSLTTGRSGSDKLRS